MQKQIYVPQRGAARERAAEAMPAYTSAYAPAEQTLAQRRSHKAGFAIMAACALLAIVAVLMAPLLMEGKPAQAATAKPQATAAVSYVSLDEAAEALGFAPAIPQLLQQQATLSSISVLDGSVLEMQYLVGSEMVVYRMARGTDDITYSDKSYAFASAETVNGVTRGYAGVTETVLHTASWATDGYTYAVLAQGGLHAEDMHHIAESVA